VCDVLVECERPSVSRGKTPESAIVAASEVAFDIPGLLDDNAAVTKLVFVNSAASYFKKPKHFGEWLTTGVANTSAGVPVRCAFVVRTGSQSEPAIVRATSKMFGKYAAVKLVGDADAAGPVGDAEADGGGVANGDGGDDGGDAAHVKAGDSSGGTARADATDDDGAPLARTIELVVVPSTSPASAKLRPAQKEYDWWVQPHLAGFSNVRWLEWWWCRSSCCSTLVCQVAAKGGVHERVVEHGERGSQL
jgi:hypothetical protein